MARSGAVKAELSGVAVVCCVHNREKRVVTTDTKVAELGLKMGFVYDPKQHKIHRCMCCENLFVDPSDEPRLCGVCSKAPVYALGGPIPEPKGVVDG